MLGPKWASKTCSSHTSFSFRYGFFKLPEQGHIQFGIAKILSAKLSELGVSSEIAVTPPNVLHFKSDCCLLDEETIFCTQRLNESSFFQEKEFKTRVFHRGTQVSRSLLGLIKPLVFRGFS